MNKLTVFMAPLARTLARTFALILPAMACNAQAQAQSQTQVRQPSEAEARSFEAWLAQRSGGVRLKAGYDIQRAEGARDWTVTAWAEQPPQRAAWRLCLTRADGYSYDAMAQRWSGNGEQRNYVWLDRSADCGVSPQRVHLKQPLGERDIVTVLEQQGTVLQSARLLFAGNTQCAPQRANKFELTAIDITPDRFYQLTYVSDRGGKAVVTVRKRARELTAWGARC